MSDLQLSLYIAVAVVSFFGVLLALAVFVKTKILDHARLQRSLVMDLLLVELPQNFKKEEWNRDKEKEFISVMEQFLATISNLKEKSFYKRFLYGNPHIAIEIAVPRVGESIYFYVSVPRDFVSIVEKHIVSFYHGSQVTHVQDYNVFTPDSDSIGANIFLHKTYVVPIPTFKALSVDPLVNIITSLTTLSREGEGAAVQVLIRPANKNYRKVGLKVAESIRKGIKPDVAIRQVIDRQGAVGYVFVFLGYLSKLIQFFVSKPHTPPSSDNAGPISGQPGETNKGNTAGYSPNLTAVAGGESFYSQQEIVKAIEHKSSQNLYEVNIRLVASSNQEGRAESMMGLLEQAFQQFNNPTLNYFETSHKKGKSLKDLFYRFSFRMFHESEKIILSTEEIASIIHFPQPTLMVPKIAWLRSKQTAAPPDLPQEGLIVGENVYRNERRQVRMLLDDRRRHQYIIGQTGTGKSNLIQNQIQQDIASGMGVALIDPHGDLSERVLSLVPSNRADDVIYFNPPDIARPIGLNMLEYDPRFPESKTFIVNEMLEIFDKLYNLKQNGFGGPIFEQYMRNALLLVMEDPATGNTLLEVPRVLADTAFRKLKLSRCQNLIVKNFWEKEAEKAGGEASLANIVPYITSKMNMFTANDIMRPIISQQKSAFSFRELMDSRKILIANLAKGNLGDTNSHLLGMVLVGKLFLAALSRVDTPEDKRADFFLYMDEFQNITTKSIAGILAEARKYRLALVMAHQYIAQLEDDIKNAVFGNVGSLMSFRIGTPDAEFLVKYFEPVFDQNDLVNIDNYNMYAKIMIQGRTSNPFNVATIKPTPGDAKILDYIKQNSRLRYGRNRDEVEKETYDRLKGLPIIAPEPPQPVGP